MAPGSRCCKDCLATLDLLAFAGKTRPRRDRKRGRKKGLRTKERQRVSESERETKKD